MVDFFNQISDALQWFWDLCKEGVSNVENLPTLFTNVSNRFEQFTALLPPFMLPLVSFAVCAALLLRFLRLD